MWWYWHLVVIALQLFAIYAYFTGSRRFYIGKENFLRWIGTGILLDFLIMFIGMVIKLPKMSERCEVPWYSSLFVIHIIMSTIGMVGFIVVFFYILKNGTENWYGKLRKFQYKVLFPIWFLGVLIALANFFVKVVWGIRLYDL